MKTIFLLIFILLRIGCGNSEKPNVQPDFKSQTPINLSPTISPKPDSTKDISYEKLTFKTLNGFKVLKKTPPSVFDTNAVQETDQEKSEQINKQVPEEIKLLNGKNIEISGFAFPLKLVKGKAKDLILMSVVPSCCFGDKLKINDLIYISAPNNTLNVKENQYLKIKGKLTVEAKLDDDKSFLFLYWINAESIELSKPEL